MRSPMWKRLGLTEDEWLDCRRSAIEMSLAGGARVSARQVAVEFALARSFDEPVIELAREDPPRTDRARMMSAS